MKKKTASSDHFITEVSERQDEQSHTCNTYDKVAAGDGS